MEDGWMTGLKCVWVTERVSVRVIGRRIYSNPMEKDIL